jgi:hypothetical protein
MDCTMDYTMDYTTDYAMVYTMALSVWEATVRRTAGVEMKLKRHEMNLSWSDVNTLSGLPEEVQENQKKILG